MKLTKKKAIEITIELWEWLAETGKDKEDWEGWKNLASMVYNCPLCEYATVTGRVFFWDRARRHYCPLPENNNGRAYQCFKLGYSKWEKAERSNTCQKYAKLFLEELRKLK